MMITRKIARIRDRRKAKVSLPPKHITIHVTSACSNKCLFCAYHADDAKGKSKAYGLSYMMSIERFKKIVNMAYESGVSKVHICATGEPFCHPDILEMIDYVVKIYGRVSFQTNFEKRIFEHNNYLEEIIKRADGIKSITTDVLSSDPQEYALIKNGSSYKELLEALQILSKRASNIKIVASIILTRKYYHNLKGIIDDFYKRGIKNCSLEIFNLFPYNFSEFTSVENVYRKEDTDITRYLKEMKKYGKSKGIEVSIPKPAGYAPCKTFWNKLQLWPTAGCKLERGDENMLPQSCPAVVCGDLASMGYLMDYESIMEAWNNDYLVKVRSDLLRGIYPDEYCKICPYNRSKESIWRK